MPNILSAPLLLAAFASLSVETPPAAENLALAAASVPRPALQAPASPRPVNNHRVLSVLTYNIRGMPWPAARNRRQALREIGAELAELRRQGRAPDIVLIQEGFEPLDELVAASGYKNWVTGPQKGDRPDPELAPAKGGFIRARYPTSGEGWGKLTSAGLHVLSDLPIMAVETAAYSYCAGWDCLANKGVMMVRLEIPGLPAGIDVVNTHMNSRDAAKVPWSRSLVAHNLQVREMNAFVAHYRRPDAPLLVGGDFNVKDAPDRYYYLAGQRPFTVVSEFCRQQHHDCDRDDAALEPWLLSEDLQAFSDGGGVSVRPVDCEVVFDGGPTGPRLSDHDGYLVRYELSWR